MATKRNWDIISDDKRRKYISELIGFFEIERDEKIGIIAAEKILDHFLQNLGTQLYNKGVEDSMGFFKEYLENLELNMELTLKKQVEK